MGKSTIELAREKMRTGDHVLHTPSGEEWVVAWADHSSGRMAPCGWPTCQALIADCTVIKAATDEESAKLVDSLSVSGRTDAHRARALATAHTNAEKEPSNG